MQPSPGAGAVRPAHIPPLTRLRPSGLVRLLMYVGVLAGVLAMHGLTTDHDAAMLHSPPAQMAVAGEAAVSGHEVALSMAAEPMGAMCIAVLASVLLVSLVLRLLWLRSARVVRRAVWAGVSRSAVVGRAPPWVAPSLSKLCVLRT